MKWIITGLVMAFAIMGACGAPTHLVDESPVEISKTESGIYIVDFGRVAFGNLRLLPPAGMDGEITVHFGEDFVEGRINRKPPQTVRYNKTTVELEGGKEVVAAPPADGRNTRQNRKPPAILTPEEWGVVLPFRWIEIEGWKGELKPEHMVRQSAFLTAWDDNAASFESSDKMLNQIWELCRYSIKATTVCGVYVDGDRERIPYEADAYLNQLSHYYTDHDKQISRDTYDHMMIYPTWPTEWTPHMVFIAHADWMHTGDTEWLKARYEGLKTKLLLERRGEDGLITSNAQQIKRDDIIDWPVGERDGYVRTRVNTVVNAFHIRALEMMAELADILDEKEDAAEFASKAKISRAAFQKNLFDSGKGLYLDGVETDHISSHGNFFPLAFGLVPEASREKMAGWLAERGMTCSVYGAQYLMEALFENGADKEAIELMTAKNDRSWRHMVESGATISWEAWDHKYKSNQDWNHAWGAAPANLLPRYVLGVEPITSGWKVARIRPCPAGLEFAKGRVPTPRGPIDVEWKQSEQGFSLTIALPEGMSAGMELPGDGVLYRNGKPVKAKPEGGRLLWWLSEGSAVFEVREK